MKSNGAALLDLALADPTQALSECTVLLADPGLDPHEQVGYLRARGLAHRMLGNLDLSTHDLEAGLKFAQQLDDSQLRARVALTLAGTRVFQGQIEDAKAILLDCIDNASGEVRAEAIFQLGTTHAQAGESADCLRYYAQALPLLRHHGRRDWESNLLGNRGIIHFWAGNFEESIRDLDDAIEIQNELGITAQAAINTLNKAQALFMMGELAASLDLYREAENTQAELGMPVLMHAQKIETYLAAGKFEDCLTLSQQTHRFHRESEMTIGQIRALLPGAEAALALGQNTLAARLAAEIPRINGAENFAPWVDRADLTRLEAKLLDKLVDENDKQSALDIYAAASKTHTSTALRALLLASTISLVRGSTTEANELLEQSARLARRSPLHLQIQRWQLVSTLRSNNNDRRGALSAVRSGLRAFDRLLLGVTSYDTRVRASRHTEGLAAIGLRELVASRRFGDAVQLTERVRSASIRRPKVSAKNAQALIAADTKLRTDQPGASAAELLRLQKSLHHEPRSRAGHEQPRTDESVLTWIEVAGVVYCLHGRTHRTELHRCGTGTEIGHLVEEHRFAHRQLSHRNRLSRAAVSSLFQRQADADNALDATLLPPLLRDQVVLNPTAQLTDLVWGSLPSLTARPHVVAPSLSLARQKRPRRLTNAAVFGSSTLAYISTELDAVAQIYGATAELDPEQDVASAIDGVDVVHLAGHFESDGSNPLFSGISLGVGRLRGVDYLQLARAPELAVLSACASAETEEIGGTAAGFVTAALTAGTPSVIATQTLIEDDTDTVATMQHLHSLLHAGTAPAHALLTVRREAPEDSLPPRNLVVYGVGW